MGVAPRRARLALVSAVALLGAACAAPADDPDPDASNAASSTSTPPGEGGEPSATYARYEVDPPGEYDGRLNGDDMLLVSTETIPDDVVEQILAIRIAGQKAVTAAEPLSIGEFSLENKGYRVAAVDAADYRRFTPQTSAVLQDAWDRVAAGEIAVDQALEPRLPVDKDGYLAVGSGERTFPIHVGAFVDQVGTIDAVVNTEWGEQLGLVENNALVLYTGVISPQALRKKLKPIVGDISMTDLDIVAEEGIDPNTFQTAVLVGTFSEAVGVFNYTPIGGGRIQPDPAWVREHIVTETVPILGELTCNKYMMPQLKAALAEVQRRGLANEIKYHVGCYYPRFIHGSTTLSNHSFGLAIDINSLENQRGTVGQMHPDVVSIFKYWGFAWGGDWAYTDPMHFELEQIKNPG
ncbi:M15 family peptidase [Nocardioides immobilis]|uniref:M15 family peptidase n=1 Tax=Nocardioides immobilis TaxID=2049295 RepID=A0A417Y030_9ACTN|nr:M15 family metallopeptidase [Nocardioides immobilis]RHW25973.1 M15 family peptidase [Nocardioides immobilis]